MALESLFAGVFGWLTRRLAGVAVAALTAAAIYGAWLFVRQEALQEWDRRSRLQSAVLDREKIGRAREALAARTNELGAETKAQEARLREATPRRGRKTRNGSPGQTLCSRKRPDVWRRRVARWSRLVGSARDWRPRGAG